MQKITLTFHKLIQDSQDFGSDDSHMISRAFFTIESANGRTGELFTEIKQTVGSDFETAPLEVRKPQGYDGPFNFSAFQNAAETYYRRNVGSSASGIRIAGNATVRMRNNTFINSQTFEIECESNQNGGW